jgi:recombination protein RecR
MTATLPASIERLIGEFARLPGVGPKTASRLVFFLLTKPESDVRPLGEAILNLRTDLVTCATCFGIATESPCATCTDPSRDRALLAVVEEPLDVLALDRSGFTGRYHVLGGVISPIDGIGPNELRIAELVDRLTHDTVGVREVILATNPSLEGEATALYVQQQLRQVAASHPNVAALTVTRIARGLPMGSDLEYADDVTIKRSLEGRRVIE